MFCPSCGIGLQTITAFCTQCGSRIPPAVPVTSPNVVYAAPREKTAREKANEITNVAANVGFNVVVGWLLFRIVGAVVLFGFVVVGFWVLMLWIAG